MTKKTISGRAVSGRSVVACLVLAGIPTMGAAQTASSATAATPPAAQPSLDPQVDRTSPSATLADVGEIVVTAQKRTERLVQVPLAVTAITGDTLAKQQVNDSLSLIRSIPSLSYQQGGGPNNSSFRVRGVGTSLFGQGVEPSVSVVVDGVVSARAGSGFTDLVDIDRVEVLRGPQGTLFGKNATAGVINVVTARPLSTFGGNIEATVAEMGEYRVKSTVTGPLGDTLKGRISGFYNKVGGYYHNVKTDSDEGGFKSYGGRAKLEWQPVSTLTLLATLEHRSNNANCCVTPFIRVENPVLKTVLGPVVAKPDNFTVNNDDLSRTKTRLSTAALQADWDLGAATLTSITAYQRYFEDNRAEVDYIPSVPTPFLGAGAAFASWNEQVARQWQNSYTQELRIGSNGTTDLTYVAGIFASELDLHRTFNRRRQTCSAGVIGQPCTGTIANQSGGFDARFNSKNAAAFGQIDWRAVGGLHLLGGARLQYEKQRVDGRVFGAYVPGDANFPGVTLNSGVTRAKDTAVTGRAGARYEFNRNMQAYATYTRGYKAFALDLTATTRFDNQAPLRPEHVNAYELGFKTRTADGMFDVNIAVFRSDYTNLQTQTVISDPATGTFNNQQINAGKSRSQGVEFESVFRPSRSFSIAANVSYTDATIDIDGVSCAVQQQAAAPTLTSNFPTNSCYRKQITVNGVTSTSPQIVDVRNGKLPLAPKWRATLAPTLDFGLGDRLKATLSSNVTYTSRQLFAINQDPLLTLRGYALVDVFAGIATSDDRYRLTVFVRNLFDKYYYTNMQHASVLSSTTFPNELTAYFAKDARRYFGATGSVRF